MAERHAARPTSMWVGPGDSGGEAGGGTDVFGGGAMWIGEHIVDGDVLVFDPAEASPTADALAFFSMTQFRIRVFPRAVVARQLREVTDDLRSARAKKDYGRRTELSASLEVDRAAARAAVSDRQRAQVIARHERYMTSRDIPYKGVKDTPPDRRPSRRVRCHSCGIALDDFAASLCGVCSDVLCSCGACACGRVKGS